LLGCLTTREPDLNDYGLFKARQAKLCIQASRQALMRLCLERSRGSDLGILPSLKTCGVVKGILVWIRELLLGRTQRFRVGGQLSEEVRVMSGVPQGIVLGPLLFLA